MFTIIRDIQTVDFGQLMSVYEESNLNYGRRKHPHGSIWEQLRCGEDFLREDIDAFLRQEECILALWSIDGLAVSALRLEPYSDGLLLSCLETAPKARGRGSATKLIACVLAEFPDKMIYAHVYKKNRSSMRIHQKNGFGILKESACLLDGTVTHNYYTLINEPKKQQPED